MRFFRCLVVHAGRLSLLGVGSLALLAPRAQAQDAAGPGQSEPTTPQTTSAQRIEITGRQGATDLRRASRVAKQIYGREELDKYGDTNALDVMRRLPGVNVGAGGPRMRGLGAGYTQILINGDPMPPGFALDQTQRRSRTHTVDLYGLWVFRPGLSMRLAVAEGAQPFGPPNGWVTTLLNSGDSTRVERRTGPQFNASLDIRL